MTMTDRDIRLLRDQAYFAGDHTLVEQCERALIEGNSTVLGRRALADCLELIDLEIHREADRERNPIDS